MQIPYLSNLERSFELLKDHSLVAAGFCVKRSDGKILVVRENNGAAMLPVAMLAERRGVDAAREALVAACGADSPRGVFAQTAVLTGIGAVIFYYTQAALLESEPAGEWISIKEVCEIDYQKQVLEAFEVIR